MSNVVFNGEGEKHRLKVFEDRVLKKVSELKRDKVEGEQRRLLN